MWREVLQRLPERVDIRPVDQRTMNRLKQRRRGPPDAWLFDGHNGPLAVPEPQVIHLLEAPWNEPDTMETLSPRFVDMIVDSTRRAARAASTIICPSE